MKVEVLEKNGSEIKFSIQGITPAFANALRRIMFFEVPTMAIEWVDFKKNDSALPDELLANRLGQMPLTFDKKAYSMPDDCKCEGKGCSKCQVELVLKKKGPAIVYSGDLKSRDKDVQPVFDKIPLDELFEGEELQFEAVAQLGLGKEHVKWQAAVVGYSYDNNNNFTFTVESACGLKPEEVVASAAEVLEEKTALFGKELKKLK
jgi:DNA-directed RNA polymerase subunit D